MFLFFGLVAVLGTAYLQPRAVTGPGLAVTVAMGSFAGAILVANNLLDVASDGPCRQAHAGGRARCPPYPGRVRRAAGVAVRRLPERGRRPWTSC